MVRSDLVFVSRFCAFAFLLEAVFGRILTVLYDEAKATFFPLVYTVVLHVAGKKLCLKLQSFRRSRFRVVFSLCVLAPGRRVRACVFDQLSD